MEKNIIVSTSLIVVLIMLCNPSFSHQDERVNNTIDSIEIEGLKIRDTIPEELWDLPLSVINHPEEKEVITLNDFRNEPFILLDFWSRYCGPCIRTLHSFDNTAKSIGKNLPIISIYVDNPNGLERYMVDQNWNIPAVIKESKLLNSIFFNRKQYGGLVLIVDGIFYASPDGKDLTREVFIQMLKGITIKFETKYPDLLHSNDRDKLM